MSAARFVTDCGAPLFVIEIPNAKNVALGALVHAGARDENPRQTGLAHAVEHMVFRGNAKFPSSDLLTGHLEKIGGEVNAWTSKEATFFHALVAPDYLKQGVEYLRHLVTSPAFRRRYLPPEMNNIIGEIKSRNDCPEELVKDLSEEVLFGKHPLGKRILGTVKSVSDFTRDDFLDWHRQFYNPRNFAFIAVGAVESGGIPTMINPKWNPTLKIFNQFFRYSDWGPSGVQNIRRSVPLPVPGAKRFVLRKDVEQVHLVLTALINPGQSRSTRALRLFQQMLDGGMSFPLFQELREKRGIGYKVEAKFIPFSDSGLFQIYVGVSPEKLESVLQATRRIIQTTGTNRKLFREAKGSLLNAMAADSPDSEKILDQAAEDISLAGKPKSLEQNLAEIKKVKLSEVSGAVRQYLKPENFVQTMIVPKRISV